MKTTTFCKKLILARLYFRRAFRTSFLGISPTLKPSCLILADPYLKNRIAQLLYAFCSSRMAIILIFQTEMLRALGCTTFR